MRVLSEAAVCDSVMSRRFFVALLTQRGPDCERHGRVTSRRQNARRLNGPVPQLLFASKTMRSHKSRYRGFRLVACAAPDGNGLHAASVSIEKQGYPARSFSDLDSFHDDVDALEYATTWGRIWIEANMRFSAPAETARGR